MNWLTSKLGWSLGFILLAGCATAQLEPGPGAQPVPNKPRAASVQRQGVQVIAEPAAASVENVRDEVTTMRVTIVNRSENSLTVDYSTFSLVSDDGEVFQPIKPDDITIRNRKRGIGQPPDAMVIRGSDSSTGMGPNSPYRAAEEREEIRKQLNDQALDSSELGPGERTSGFIYFQRVPGTKRQITLRSALKAQSGDVITADVPFQVRKNP